MSQDDFFLKILKEAIAETGRGMKILKRQLAYSNSCNLEHHDKPFLDRRLIEDRLCERRKRLKRQEEELSQYLIYLGKNDNDKRI